MKNKLRSFRLPITVFACGAIVMIYELVGSRVVSPYYGNSLFIWTALIGIIMAGLSFGYYVGGRIADRIAEYRVLALIVLVSGLFIGLSAFTKEVILSYFSKSIDSMQLSSFISILLLFWPASFFMAMVSPYAAKLELKNIKNGGRVIGSLYALSTAGSIIGTFLAGYYLIPAFGNLSLLYLLSIVLIVLSFYISMKNFSLKIAVLLLVLLLGYLSIYRGVNKLKVMADIDSQYNRIVVSREFNYAREIIALKTDNAGIQSAVFAEGDKSELTAGYLREFDISLEINPEIKKALLIGGAGFTYPAHFLQKNPQATIDVVEIDPKMVEVAKKYLFFEEESGLKIIHQDARLFPDSCSHQYDAIYLDAFSSLSPPYYLTTGEFFNSLKTKCLSKEGILLVNLISAIEGDESEFLVKEYNTLKKVFPGVFIYPVHNHVSVYRRQNLIAVARLRDDDGDIDRLIIPLIYNPDNILTDDYAPVEYLTGRYSFN